jgi:glycosyltransferase involved in cell wall biosynthesis
MRIGINILFLLPGIVGGTETYAAALLHGLATVDRQDEFAVFVNRESKNWPLPEAPNFTRLVCPISAVSRSRRYFFEQVFLPQLLKEHAIDVVHSLGYVSPLFTPCPSVVTIHDLNYRALGKYMPRVRQMSLGLFVRQSVRRVAKVITISEFARDEIYHEFGLQHERIVVTHLAPRFQSDGSNSEVDLVGINKLGIRFPYMVAFAGGGPNKNIPRLLNAFGQAKGQYQPPHQLVLIGRFSSDYLLSGFEQNKDVCLTGYLDDETLRSVLMGAQLLVFPSFYEGFGLPVLEAMACGVPVVCSNQASLPEVAGDAAVFFDPYSIEDMALKISQVAGDWELREELKQKGLDRAKHFSWEKTAQETLAVYTQVYREARWQK